MQYRQLGKSGLKISALSFGSWLTFGEKIGLEEAKICLKHAYDHGVNFFDNAEVYRNGLSEEVMGKAIKAFRRESLVISTKIFWGGEAPNDVGLSRKHLIEGTRNSLKRLQLDYVDLLYCHRPDPTTPIEETVRAMDYLVREGLALYWGTSEWKAEEITMAYQLAKELGCIPPSMEQPQYNLFHRQRVEQEYMPLYAHYGMGTTTFAPLAFGLLSGKYNEGIPPDARLAQYPEWRAADMETRIDKVKNLVPIAKEQGCTLAQLAIAWCLKKPHVNSVILGASSLEQLKENLHSLNVAEQLTAHVIEKMEVITSIESKTIDVM
jgi:voltage-dependent potassium channel beta subunit